MTYSAKIKLCGLFRACDIDYANEAQPDYVGFVFARSPRQVTREQAADYRRRLDPRIPAVGVFVNAQAEQVTALLADGIIQMAQLHGNETEEEIRAIRKASGRPVIKAVKVRERGDIVRWLSSQADYLLFDSGAGSGEVFDWSLLTQIGREYFLAGGLKPENIPEAVRRLHPYAVDVSSGVETDGAKDREKMLRAVAAVRGHG